MAFWVYFVSGLGECIHNLSKLFWNWEFGVRIGWVDLLLVCISLLWFELPVFRILSPKLLNCLLYKSATNSQTTIFQKRNEFYFVTIWINLQCMNNEFLSNSCNQDALFFGTSRWNLSILQHFSFNLVNASCALLNRKSWNCCACHLNSPVDFFAPEMTLIGAALKKALQTTLSDQDPSVVSNPKHDMTDHSKMATDPHFLFRGHFYIPRQDHSKHRSN